MLSMLVLLTEKGKAQKDMRLPKSVLPTDVEPGFEDFRSDLF